MQLSDGSKVAITGLPTVSSLGTGPQGLPGTNGVNGTPGKAGTNGAAGVSGTCGVQGADGPSGPAGPQGMPGETGPVGRDGQQGPTGPIGPQGIQGNDGQEGPQGATGPQGIPGAVGLPGPPGPIGPIGPQGIQGAAGSDGVTGIQGPTGLQGPVGATGSTGAAGTNGTNGTDGATGAAGPTYPLYTAMMSVTVAAASVNTQFYFDFTAWFTDFATNFPDANASDFVVIPIPIMSSQRVGNPAPAAQAALGPGSIGDYAFVVFGTSPPTYLDSCKHKFWLTLGATGLGQDGSVHAYSTNTPVSYNIQFLGGASVLSLVNTSSTITMVQNSNTSPPAGF